MKDSQHTKARIYHRSRESVEQIYYSVTNRFLRITNLMSHWKTDWFLNKVSENIQPNTSIRT